MSKFEWRKEEKDLYIPKATPTVVRVPKQKFFTLTGIGNPNTSPELQEKIEALYNLSYKIKMMPKSGYTPEGYFDYTVYPLEGIWSLIEDTHNKNELNKDNLKYTIMIRQPYFVNENVFQRALDICKKKKDNPFLEKVILEEIEDGLCVQMLHIGSFDDEYKSFQIIEEFLKTHNYERTTLDHREIYLNDFRKVDSTKLKTTLRVFVTKNT